MKGICSIMELKGIKDIDSQEGINLCLDCSLSKCELDVGKGAINRVLLIKKAKELDGCGLGIDEIAQKLGRHKRTIYRYLEEVEDGKDNN